MLRKWVLVVAFLLVLGLLASVFISKPILLKTIVGSARILYPPISATIKVNGEVQQDFVCFKTTAFSGESNTERLVIYRRNAGSNEVMIIDLVNKDGGLPNAGEDDYLFLWNYFLFQSESGAAWAPFSSPKMDCSDPKKTFESNYIKFETCSGPTSKTFEISLEN